MTQLGLATRTYRHHRHFATNGPTTFQGSVKKFMQEGPKTFQQTLTNPGSQDYDPNPNPAP